MATLTKGKTFTNGELVTPAALHSMVDSGTVTNIVNADISNNAAIADSKLAQIATAGKVANTATTATSSNAANAIVSRDAGGSFTAGTITAALSGNAATATTAAACSGNAATATTAAACSGNAATATTAAACSGNAATATTAAACSGNAATATTAAACSGNAATATTLQAARTINGVSFNGSGNITVTAAPTAHNHAISDTTGLQTALDGKQANLGFTPVQQGGGAGQLGNSLKIGWSSNNLLLEVDTTNFGNTWPINISGTANPVAHTHDDRYYTETETNTLLAGKQASGSYAAAAHTHAISDTTGLQTALDGKQAAGSYAAASHTHDASAITSGTLANARTTATSANTANAIVSRDAGGSFTAGTITAALSGNAATATTAAACSGNAATATTLQAARTINGVSFNGSGNITVTAAPTAHNHAISDTTGLQTALDGKQASGSYAAHNHDASAITSGTLANARTTATSANTANAIVARDASGDFLAGKINGITVGKGGGSVNTNTALGVEALNVNSNSGIFNTAVGYNALKTNTDGIVNTATGTNALRLNTSGSYNTATGFQSLTQNTTGIQNTAHGTYASNYNITGSNNTSCGYSSLYTSNGNHNVAIGSNALENLANASQSTAIGSLALQNNINYSQSSGVGYNAQVTGSSQLQLGNSTATTYAYGAVQDRSDVRDKADIRDTTLGLDFVNALRPVDFKWDMREDYRPEAPQAPDQDASQEAKAAYETAKAKWLEDVKLANITHDGSKKRGRYHHGLIAQEVKAVLDSKGIDFGGYQDHSIKGGDDVLSIGYEELIAPMLKAIQELAAEIAALKSGK